MNHHHLQQQRRAASEAFLESLEQMSLCFQSNLDAPVLDAPALDAPAHTAPAPAIAEPNQLVEPFDIEALEAAIADIEQFMQHKD